MTKSAAGPSRLGKSATPEDILAPINVSEFDWKSYEGTYKGRALITRIQHIPELLLGPNAHPTPHSLSFARAALLRLVPLIKSETWDHRLYLQVVAQIDATLHPEKIGRQLKLSSLANDASEKAGEEEMMDVEGSGGGGVGDRKGDESEGVPDMVWVEETMEAERKETTRLDVELKGYMSNLIKESIRLTYLASARLSLKLGSATNALKNLIASREYSTSQAHLLEIALGVIETCLTFMQSNTLPGQISKVEASIDRMYPPELGGPTTSDEATTAAEILINREKKVNSNRARHATQVKVRVAKGFIALTIKEYERAARHFAEVWEEGGLGDWEGKTISTSEMTLVTAICGLATFSREDVKRLLLDRASFRTGLDDTQGWILDLIRNFVEARYEEVMGLLPVAERALVLSPMLYADAANLLDLIRTRAIVQYVLPFSSVKISTMADAFGMVEDDMLAEVEGLVENGRIGAKIDLIDRVLEMKATDPREDLFTQALDMGENTSAVTRAGLFRMKLVETGVVVDPRKDTSNMSKGKKRLVESNSDGLQDGWGPHHVYEENMAEDEVLYDHHEDDEGDSVDEEGERAGDDDEYTLRD